MTKITKEIYEAALANIGRAYRDNIDVCMDAKQVQAIGRILVKVGALMHRETTYKEGRVQIITKAASNSFHKEWPQEHDIDVRPSHKDAALDFVDRVANEFPHAEKIKIRNATNEFIDPTLIATLYFRPTGERIKYYNTKTGEMT